MSFTFSEKSLKKLKNVKPKLVKVAREALIHSTLDFGITCGIRTLEEQEYYVKTGRSHTLKSKHLTGDAIDIVAYKNGLITWDIPAYATVAESFKEVSKKLDIPIRWGGAWFIYVISDYKKNLSEAIEDYKRYCKETGKTAFIDAVHFELVS